MKLFYWLECSDEVHCPNEKLMSRAHIWYHDYWQASFSWRVGKDKRDHWSWPWISL